MGKKNEADKILKRKGRRRHKEGEGGREGRSRRIK